MSGGPDLDGDPFSRFGAARPAPAMRPRNRRRRPSARVRRRRALVGAVAALALLWAGVSGVRALTHDDPVRPAAGLAGSPSPTAAGSPSAEPTPSDTPSSDTPSPTPSGDAPSPSVSPSPTSSAGTSDVDARAGLLDRSVPDRGSGKLVTVPGSSPAPHKGRLVRVRVRVEGGLHVDGARFAAYAMATLNDPRSWTHDGYTFARTDSAEAADVTLVLASPTLSRSMCRPLETKGTLSCHQGANTGLTLYRWVLATPDYHGDYDGYRHYLVNHEVGHALGHGHEYCPGSGKRAPVMMQQTKGLKGCRANPWPYP